MKTTDERVRDVLARARVREAASRRRRKRAVAIGGGALSVVIVVVVGVGIASMAVPAAQPSADVPLGLMGSVLADSSALGYIVTGLIGLLLGVVLTVAASRAGGKPQTGELQGLRKLWKAEMSEGEDVGYGEGAR